MLNSQRPRTRILVTLIVATVAAFGSTAGWAQTVADNSSSKTTEKKVAAPKTQKQLDFEHQLLQSDGFNHLRETVKGNAAAKNQQVTKSSAPKTQKDLDFEHQLLQSDGFNHLQETVKGNAAAKNKIATKSSAPKTQKDLDFEHQLLQSDGYNHLRELLKK